MRAFTRRFAPQGLRTCSQGEDVAVGSGVATWVFCRSISSMDGNVEAWAKSCSIGEYVLRVSVLTRRVSVLHKPGTEMRDLSTIRMLTICTWVGILNESVGVLYDLNTCGSEVTG